MIISISHVVSWYDLSNPYSWAIYLSVAIEIAAMSSIAAASVKVRGGVWLVFIIVTLIQFIGNIFFSYNDIDTATKEFKSWVELTGPIFELLGSDVSDIVSQKRWLALISGGLLPIISLASLHFFIKYDGKDEKVVEVKEEPTGSLSWTAPEITPKDDVVVEEVTKEIKEEEPLTAKVDVYGPMSNQLNAIEVNKIKKATGTDKWSNG
jgi:hypothetical protein